MNALYIHVHSVVDLITNSSSELFVDATNTTETAAVEILNAILKASGSEKTASDLFDVKLAKFVRHYEATDSDDKEFDSDEEITAFLAEHDVDDYDEGVKKWNVLKITPKKGTSADLKKIAKLLETFGLTYEATECQQ